jgi:hypothetical protein
MWCKIAHETAGLVFSDVRREEMLPVQVGVFYHIMIEYPQTADGFAAQALADLAADAAGSDHDTARIREARLIKASDQFLAMGNRKSRIGRG